MAGPDQQSVVPSLHRQTDNALGHGQFSIEICRMWCVLVDFALRERERERERGSHAIARD